MAVRIRTKSPSPAAVLFENDNKESCDLSISTVLSLVEAIRMEEAGTIQSLCSRDVYAEEEFGALIYLVRALAAKGFINDAHNLACKIKRDSDRYEALTYLNVSLAKHGRCQEALNGAVRLLSNAIEFSTYFKIPLGQIFYGSVLQKVCEVCVENRTVAELLPLVNDRTWVFTDLVRALIKQGRLEEAIHFAYQSPDQEQAFFYLCQAFPQMKLGLGYIVHLETLLETINRTLKKQEELMQTRAWIAIAFARLGYPEKAIPLVPFPPSTDLQHEATVAICDALARQERLPELRKFIASLVSAPSLEGLPQICEELARRGLTSEALDIASRIQNGLEKEAAYALICQMLVLNDPDTSPTEIVNASVPDPDLHHYCLLKVCETLVANDRLAEALEIAHERNSNSIFLAIIRTFSLQLPNETLTLINSLFPTESDIYASALLAALKMLSTQGNVDLCLQFYDLLKDTPSQSMALIYICQSLSPAPLS